MNKQGIKVFIKIAIYCVVRKDYTMWRAVGMSVALILTIVFGAFVGKGLEKVEKL